MTRIKDYNYAHNRVRVSECKYMYNKQKQTNTQTTTSKQQSERWKVIKMQRMSYVWVCEGESVTSGSSSDWSAELSD